MDKEPPNSNEDSSGKEVKECEDITQPGTSGTSHPSTSMASTSSEEKPSDTSVDQEDDDEDELVTLNEVLNEREELESDARALLGNSDDKKCTYDMDYVSRQPLYACNTCEMKVDDKTGEKHLAGFCLACSYHCHEGHEVFELYTKRCFRCDCGNEKFANTTCKLTEKTGFNENNGYNQNFAGLYCTCHRPYPDPDDHVSDYMVQCGLCEDWFHKRHLNLKDKSKEFTEMVCFLCVKKYGFLAYYDDYGSFIEKDDPIDENENETESLDSGIVAAEPIASTSSNEPEISDFPCKLAQLKQNYLAKYKTDVVDEDKFCTMLLGENWRSVLCKCATCVEMYRNLGVEFIASKSDMVYFYEQNTIKLAKESEKESELKELNKLPHIQKIEILHAYNDLKTEFQKFLEPFRRDKRVVRTEDVNEFIDKLKSRKRQRVDVPYFCK